MRFQEVRAKVRTLVEREALRAHLRKEAKATDACRGGANVPDIVRLPSTVDPRHMADPELFLDAQTLDSHCRKMSRPLGAIEPRFGARFSLAVTKRVLKRISRRLENSGGLDARLIERAWFFPLWTELCTLIPLRHVARHLARVAGDKTIVVPLRATQLAYLSYWSQNDLEPLYIAFALRREGARVVLVLLEEAKTDRDDDGSLSLDFKPLIPWCRAGRPEAAHRDVGKTALIVDGVRGLHFLLNEHRQALKVEATFSPGGIAYDADLWGEDTTPSAFSIRFQSRAGHSTWSKASLFSAPEMSFDLIGLLTSVLAGPTKSAFGRALSLVDTFQLRNVQVCDHLFFHSAIMAHAVACRSGTVGLWPHSSNAGNPIMYEPGDAASVVCTTRQAALTWAKRLPGVPCRIRSELTLHACREPRPLTNAPLTVVVLGGGYALGRMPILDCPPHEESYRRLFTALSRLGPRIRALFKAKTTWETTNWLQEVLGPSVRFEETTQSPKEIDEPNLIFVTVSFGSTALLEGLGRGIPCMIVREFAVDDYTGLDNRYVPIGSVDRIVGEIERCYDPRVLEDLCRRQLLWYAEETVFDG